MAEVLKFGISKRVECERAISLLFHTYLHIFILFLFGGGKEFSTKNINTLYI